MDWSNPDFFWKNFSKFLHSQRPEGGTNNLALGVGGDVWKYMMPNACRNHIYDLDLDI